MILIRHAPIAEPGRLCGRTDVAARIETVQIDALRQALPRVSRIVSSPARRCRQTADALWPGDPHALDECLWEQDFGAHDGLPFADLPDLGQMRSEMLAQWAPPGGESFADLCARVAPALRRHARAACALDGPLVIVAHAGVIRAALAQVTGSVPAGLAFEIANLSRTRLRCAPEGPLSVIEVNRS